MKLAKLDEAISKYTGELITEAKWVAGVKTKWEPKEGIFKRDAMSIAKYLKRESKDLKQAMSRLNFYINRSGSNLSATQKRTLEKAKLVLQKLFGKKINESTCYDEGVPCQVPMDDEGKPTKGNRSVNVEVTFSPGEINQIKDGIRRDPSDKDLESLVEDILMRYNNSEYYDYEHIEDEEVSEEIPMSDPKGISDSKRIMSIIKDVINEKFHVHNSENVSDDNNIIQGMFHIDSKLVNRLDELGKLEKKMEDLEKEIRGLLKGYDVSFDDDDASEGVLEVMVRKGNKVPCEDASVIKTKNTVPMEHMPGEYTPMATPANPTSTTTSLTKEEQEFDYGAAIETMDMNVEDKDRAKFDELLNSACNKVDPKNELAIKDAVNNMYIQDRKKLYESLKAFNYEDVYPVPGGI